jgi:hypothetical protein
MACLFIATYFCGVLANHQLITQTTDFILISTHRDEVEISNIRILRVRSNNENHAQMSLELNLSSEWETTDTWIVKILDLEPIADDTGKLLSTKERLAGLLGGKGVGKEAIIQHSWSFGMRSGVKTSLELEGPARSAATIKSVKGKVVVSRATIKTVGAFDLAKSAGKTLDHPLLKDLPIEVIIRMDKENNSIVSLKLDQSKSERIHRWGVLDAEGKEITRFRDGPNILERTFDGKLPDGSELLLVIVRPIESRVFEFDLKAVELP